MKNAFARLIPEGIASLPSTPTTPNASQSPQEVKKEEQIIKKKPE